MRSLNINDQYQLRSFQRNPKMVGSSWLPLVFEKGNLKTDAQRKVSLVLTCAFIIMFPPS